MPTDTASLVANSVCVNSCIPNGLQLAVLIKQFADLAGQPTDAAGIQFLIDNSVCINSCIPAGLQMAVLINLLSQISGLTPLPPTLPCVNIIIPGSQAYVGGLYSFSLLPGVRYKLIGGPNETSYANGSAMEPTPASLSNGQVVLFTAAADGFFYLNGSGLVTATLCIQQSNWRPWILPKNFLGARHSSHRSPLRRLILC